MENMEDFCVSHNYTQRNFLLLRRRRHRRHHHPPPPPLYMYIHCFSELRRIILK